MGNIAVKMLWTRGGESVDGARARRPFDPHRHRV